MMLGFTFALQNENRMFTGPEAKDMIGAPGHHVNNPHLEKYRVFIQNSGGGQRSINVGEYLLYDTTYKVSSLLSAVYVM